MQAGESSEDADRASGGDGHHNGIHIAFDASGEDGGGEGQQAETEPLVSRNCSGGEHAAASAGICARIRGSVVGILFLVACVAAAILSLVILRSMPREDAASLRLDLNHSDDVRALPLQRLAMETLPLKNFALSLTLRKMSWDFPIKNKTTSRGKQ